MALLAFALPVAQGRAESVVLVCVADATLIETAPDNNLGGALIVNAGTTMTFTRNRGLFRFDVAGNIPRTSRIARVDFVVEVTGQPKEESTPSTFGLHRLLKPWGEGDKFSADPLHPGLGAPATAGEATWNSPSAFTTNAWSVPGGGATNDYAPEVSAEAAIYGVGDSPYTFVSTPALVADAQAWLDDPATNFGWILIGQAEEVKFTARRFAAREDTERAPHIVIEYVPPGIDRATVTNGQFNLSFGAQANQEYAVEFRNGLSPSNAWSLLTNYPAQPTVTNRIFSEPIADGQRFYRLRLP